MFHLLALDKRRLVRSVVIHNQVHVQLFRYIGFDGVEELAEFLTAMAVM